MMVSYNYQMTLSLRSSEVSKWLNALLNEVLKTTTISKQWKTVMVEKSRASVAENGLASKVLSVIVWMHYYESVHTLEREEKIVTHVQVSSWVLLLAPYSYYD